jgi:hypothetical protein
MNMIIIHEYSTTIIRCMRPFKQWARKRAEISIIGHGYDHILNHKITSTADKCAHEPLADNIISQLPGIKKWCVDKYIQELKDAEKAAVQKARLFRDRCEDLVIATKKAEHEAIKREYRIRQFWRDSIHEGTTRGGRMLRESLKKSGKL